MIIITDCRLVWKTAVRYDKQLRASKCLIKSCSVHETIGLGIVQTKGIEVFNCTTYEKR